MADALHQLLHGRDGLRHGQHRGTMRDPVHRRQGPKVCLLTVPSSCLLGSILAHRQANISNGPSSSNFSFKCHRETPPNQRDPINVYSVNAISFHPIHGTFSTAGSDGTWHFWDKDAKHRLKGYPAVGGSITATSFNRTGDIFAYAISYDWSKGFAHNNQNYPIKIMLHAVGPDECKPRQPPRRR